MSDIKKEVKDIIASTLINTSEFLLEKKVVDEKANAILEKLLEFGVMLPPYKVGDIVYWLDAALHIVPIEVGGFKMEVVGKNGNTYVGGVYATEDEAKAQREHFRKKDCEECLKSGIKFNHLVGCENGFDCSKKPIKEECGNVWLSEIVPKSFHESDKDYGYNRCKRCYMNQKRDGDICASEHCVYAGNRQLYSKKWDEEFEKSKEN